LSHSKRLGRGQDHQKDSLLVILKAMFRSADLKGTGYSGWLGVKCPKPILDSSSAEEGRVFAQVE